MFMVWVLVDGAILTRRGQNRLRIHADKLRFENGHGVAITNSISVEIKHGHESRYLIFV